MSLEGGMEEALAQAALAVQEELAIAENLRPTGAPDEQLQTALAFLGQACSDFTAGHMDRVMVLIEGLVKAAQQAWAPSPAHTALMNLGAE